MRSRDLPTSRTFHFAHPASTVWTEIDGGLLYDTAACRATNFGHRIAVDDPPAAHELPGWIDRWRAAHAGKGVDTAYVCWESRRPDLVEVPEGCTLGRTRCMMHDQVLEPVDVPTVRPLSAAADLERAVALFTLGEGGDAAAAAYSRWYLGGLFERAASGWGWVLGDERDGELAGILAILFDTREARFQAVLTHPEHRARGVCTGLVRAALAMYQAETVGVAYLTAEEGSVAERIYRRLQFRHVTWFFELGTPGG